MKKLIPKVMTLFREIPYRFNIVRVRPFAQRSAYDLTLIGRAKLAFQAFIHARKLPHRLILAIESSSDSAGGSLYVVSVDENGRTTRLPLTVTPRFTKVYKGLH